MSTSESTTVGAFESFTPRCVATDQSGKHRIIVSPPARQGLNSKKGTQLRFVLIQQAEVAYVPRSQSRSLRRKRTHKLNFSTGAGPVLSTQPPSAVNYMKLDALAELPVNHPTFAALPFRELLHIMLPQAVTSDIRHQIRTIYVPLVELAMQHEEVYHALFTTALAFREIRRGRLAITPTMLHHSNKSVTCLRNKIRQSNTVPDDAVMITTMLLTDIATKYGTRAEIVAHFSGLRKMINMRGGIEQLEGHIPLIAMLNYADVVAGLLGIPPEDQTDEVHDDCFAESDIGIMCLEYPAHPFPSALCSDVADLPEGFQDLALSLRLSREVIRLVITANRQAFFETPDSKTRPKICCPSMVITYSRKFLHSSNRVTESIVCLSIIVAAMRSVSFPVCSEDLQLVKDLSALIMERGIEESTLDQYHHYVWTVIMAAEACQNQPSLSAITTPLLTDLLAQTARHEANAPGFLADWGKLEKVLKKYLWRHDLMDKWKSVWESSLKDLRAAAS